MDPSGTSEGLLPGKTDALKMQVFNLECHKNGNQGPESEGAREHS